MYDPTQPSEYDEQIKSVADTYGIPHDSFRKLIYTESNFNPTAVSPAGAKGIAQFMPETGKAYGLVSDEDFFNPVKSIEASGRFLSDLKKQYKGNWAAAVAHYNGGTSQGKLVLNGQAPTKEETANYIKKIGVMAESAPSEPEVGYISTNDLIKQEVQGVYEGVGIDIEPASSVNDLPYNPDLFKRNSLLDSILSNARSEKDIANERVNFFESVKYNSTLGTWALLAGQRLAMLSMSPDGNLKGYRLNKEDLDKLVKEFGSVDSLQAKWVINHAAWEGEFDMLIDIAKERVEYNKQVEKAGFGNSIVNMAAEALADPINFLPFLGPLKAGGKAGTYLVGKVFNAQLVKRMGWYAGVGVVGGASNAASEALRKYSTGNEVDIREAFLGGALMIGGLYGLGHLTGKSGKWLKDSMTRADLIETGNRLGQDLGKASLHGGNEYVGRILNNMNKKTIARWEAIKKLKPKLTHLEWTEGSSSELVRKFGRMMMPDESGRLVAGRRTTEKGGKISTTRGDSGTLTQDLGKDDRLSVDKLPDDADVRTKNDIPETEIRSVHQEGDTIFDTKFRLMNQAIYFRESIARGLKNATSKLGITLDQAEAMIYHAGTSGTISKLPEPLKAVADVVKEQGKYFESMLKNSELISGKKQLPNMLSQDAGKFLDEDGFYIPIRSDGEKIEGLINTIGKERERAIEDLREELAHNLWEGVITNDKKYDLFKGIIDRDWAEQLLKDPNYKNPIEVLQEQWLESEKILKDSEKSITELYRQIADIGKELQANPSGVPTKKTGANIIKDKFPFGKFDDFYDNIGPSNTVTRNDKVVNILDEVIANTNSDLYKGVANLLKRIMDPDLEINFYKQNFKNPNIVGFYNPVTNDIHIPANGNRQATLLHEILHAVTSRRIRSVELHGGTRLQKQAVKELEDILAEAKNSVKDKSAYGLTSVHELISEGFTNFAFYNELKNIKSIRGNVSLSTRLMQGIRKLFGLGAKDITLLDDLMGSTEKLLKGRTTTKGKFKLIDVSGNGLKTGAKYEKDVEYSPKPSVIKGLDEVDGVDTKALKAKYDKLLDEVEAKELEYEKLRESHSKLGAYEDIPDNVYSSEIMDMAQKKTYGYLNQRMDQRNFWDSNGGFDDFDPYEHRLPWDHYYKGQNSNYSVSDILNTNVMDLLEGYANRVTGDLAVLNTTGSTDGFRFLKQLVEDAGREIPQTNKNREREIRAMKMMVHQTYGLPVTGVSKSGAAATKSFVEGMFDTASNMGLFTKNAAFGIMNYFETAAGIRAYGTSFFFKNVPLVGEFLKRIQRGAPSVEDLRMLENMVFHKDIGETLFFGRELQKNLDKYNNRFVASLVTGSTMAANRSPFTKLMYHSQNTIVSTARQELLAEMVRYVHGGGINPKGFFNEKHLARLGLNEEKLKGTLEALKKMTYMDPKGGPRLSDDYVDHITPEFKHNLYKIGEYVANEVIQRETPGSMFLWKGGNHSGALKIIMQFKSFALKSINKRIVKAGNRYVYEGDMDAAYEYFIDSALQAIQTLGITSLRANAISDPEKKKKYLQRQYGVDEFSWDNFQDPDFLYHLAMKGMYDRNSRLAGLSLVTGALGITSDSAKTSISTDRMMRQGEDGKEGLTKPIKLLDKLAGYVPAVGYGQDVVNMGTAAYNLIGSGYGSKDLTDEQKERQVEYLWNGIKNTMMPNDPVFISSVINFAKEHHKEMVK